MLLIGFIGDSVVDGEFVGEISFPGLQEEFRSSASYWSISDYVSQWDAACLRFRSDAPTTCIVTSMEDPRTANFFRTWVFYRVDRKTVAAQCHILFADQLEKTFEPARAWDFVRKRRTVDAEGQRISEWQFPFAEF